MNKKTLLGIIIFAVFAILVSDTRVIGNDRFGYLTIPSEWILFEQTGSNADNLQYSDKDVIYVVTLLATSSNYTDVISFTNYVKDTLAEDDVIAEIQEVQFGSYNAYQVYGYSDSENRWFNSWVFEAEDNNIHYVGVEGPDKDSEYFQIPFTFRLK